MQTDRDGLFDIQISTDVKATSEIDNQTDRQIDRWMDRLVDR